MREATQKQLLTIRKLAAATKTQVNDPEGLSIQEASTVISELIGKLQEKNGKGAASSPPPSQGRESFRADALAGLAVKIVAQRSDLEKMIHEEGDFRQKVESLYRVFYLARQGCLA